MGLDALENVIRAQHGGWKNDRWDESSAFYGAWEPLSVDTWRRVRQDGAPDSCPRAVYVWLGPVKKAAQHDPPTVRWAVGAENGPCASYEAGKEHVDGILRANGWL